MNRTSMSGRPPSSSGPLHSRLAQTRWNHIGRQLFVSECLVLVFSIPAMLTHMGIASGAAERVVEMNWVVTIATALLTVSRGIRWATSVRGVGLRRLWNAGLVLPVIWLTGLIVIRLRLSGSDMPTSSTPYIFWTEIVLGMIGAVSLLSACRALAARTHNSAVLLAGSFRFCHRL